jgi:hypothetical protein
MGIYLTHRAIGSTDNQATGGFMAKRNRGGFVEHILERTAPVSWRAAACRAADASELPTTVWATTDPDMPFTLSAALMEPRVSKPYRYVGLITYLPTTSFRGHAGYR